jgi:Ca2+-transporting ATPase
MQNELNGLTSEEAKKRLEEYGPNALPETPPPSDLSILIAQVKNPLVYILIAAGLVTFFLREVADTTIIAIAILTNGILGFIQERKASRALYALKKLIHPTAKVVRDGVVKTIDVAEVVPGDVAILDIGVKVPADGTVIKANRLFVDEAILTGESVPVGKSVVSRQSSGFSGEMSKVHSSKSKVQVYMGTVISSGHGKMLVKLTGEETEIGKIAESIQKPDEDTPLKKQLTKFSKQLSYLVVFLTIFVFAVGLIRDIELGELFKTSVALAVSAIPEGILVGLTVVLAIGMQRILKKKGLVRNLISAETLGGVTTICIDKTGTLTEGKMQVVQAVGNEERLALQTVIANDLDDPIVIAAYDFGKSKISDHKQKLADHRRLDSIPFSSKDRFFASMNRWDKESNMVFVNGAPEYLLRWSTLEDQEKKEIRGKLESLTREGKRVMGMARKKVGRRNNTLEKGDITNSLEWVGLLAFSDPIREGVKEALVKTKSAGISLIVITGDYSQTAVSVMHQLGIDVNEDYIVLGSNLAQFTREKLASHLKKRSGVMLFARTTPEQKLNIVEALKHNGEVVAMMGDGVNDAPALKTADIGIVVGEATDVAKESADLVLLDSSFATIVAAIEEGRGIFDNVRKIILYLMSDSFEEIFAVVGAIILGATVIVGLPLPVTAAQILWINLVSDGFPDLALTIDPKADDLMQRGPRPPHEGMVTSWMRYLILIVSLSGGIIALSLYVYFYLTTSDVILARSIAFATLGINSLVYVFSIKTLRKPFWKQHPFGNMWLNLSVVAGAFLQVLPFTTPSLRNFFNVEPLTFANWAVVFVASIIMFIIIEVAKLGFKQSANSKLSRGGMSVESNSS